MYQVNSSLRYTYVRNGVYYFSRFIPKDLQQHYRCDRLVQSLRTRSAPKAKQAASMLAARLDEYWLDLRLRNSSPLFQDKFLESPIKVLSSAPLLSDAKQLYLDLKASGRSKVFVQSTERTVSYLIQCHGDRPIDAYIGGDASAFRSWLIDKGQSSSSVKRAFSIIKAIINLAISELGLEIRNVFTGIYLPNAGDSKKRAAITGTNLALIQQACESLDDEMRWLVALLSDTGMRLGEGAGLLVEDIDLEAEIPHVSIKPHEHRPLKTASSKRTVPLVGASLWAAQRIVSSEQSGFCFPRYNRQSTTNTNSASAALNKWLKSVCCEPLVIHGLRHGMRDRLRAVEAPLEMIDQIGGWSLKSVGQGYGDGYSLNHCHIWLGKIVLSTASGGCSAQT